MKAKKKHAFFVIHFHPLERFPPVINLIDYLGKNTSNKIFAISTSDKKDSVLKRFKTVSENVIVKRTPGINPNSSLRIFSYPVFYLYAFYLLLKQRPSSVLYIDTLSAWPALLYKKLRGNKVKLLVHNNEYTSQDSYAKNMRLVRWIHAMEVKMYSHAFEWISHTNEIRLQKFRDDDNLLSVENSIFKIMPNYPSIKWAEKKNDFLSTSKVRLVFVGSLGYKNMYLQETIDWVLANKDRVTLDFFAYNIDEKAKALLNSIKDGSVNYYGGCNYEELPGILTQYDVGLVMYKPFSFNTVNAVSNKVFEYLACGLDVWFSVDMTYTFKYITEGVYPKVIAVDFKNLDKLNIEAMISRTDLRNEPSVYFYENIYNDLLNKMA